MVSVLGFVLAATMGHTDPPVCRIYIVKGEATIVRRQSSHTARLVESGFEGDELKTAPGSNAEILFMQSGKRFKVMPGSSLRIQHSGFAIVSGKSPLAMQSADPSVRAVFTSITPAAAVRIRGVASISLQPTGGLKQTPTSATWHLDRKYDEYRIEVYDDAFNKLTFKQTVHSPNCPIPADTLRPGVDYRLVLLAQTDDNDTFRLTRRFRILSADDVSSMAKALDALPVPATGEGRLIALVERADVCEQFGCYDDALQNLKEAQKISDSESLDVKLGEINRRALGEE